MNHKEKKTDITEEETEITVIHPIEKFINKALPAGLWFLFGMMFTILLFMA